MIIVLLQGEKSASQRLNIACLGQFVPQKICELIFWDKGTNCIRLWVDRGNVVEAISDANLFGDIAGVEDIWAHRRHLVFD